MKRYNRTQFTGMSADELQQAIDEMHDHLLTLHADDEGNTRDNLTADEQRDFDATVILRDAAVRTLEVREQFQRNPTGSTERAYQGISITRGKSDAFNGDPLRMSATAVRDAALSALDARQRELSNHQGDTLDELIRTKVTKDNDNLDGSIIARRMLITESDAYRSAFKEMVTQDHPMLDHDEVRAMRAFKEFERAMAEGSVSTGGAGVPVTIDPTIMMTSQGSENPVLQLARKVTVTNNVFKGVSSAGTSWNFQAEAATVADGSPSLNQPVINVHMARGWIPFSIEVGQDYPGFAEEMTKLLTEGYDELLANKLVLGAGDASQEPVGLSTALFTDTTVRVAITTPGTLAAGDINKAIEALPSRFRRHASWLMGFGTSDTVAAFGNGNNLSFVTVDLSQTLQTLRTRPVYTTPEIPDMVNTTSSQNPVVVGDFSNYVVAQRAGMNVELVPHLFDASNGNRPTASRGWFSWTRVGADAVVHNAFRYLHQ